MELDSGNIRRFAFKRQKSSRLRRVARQDATPLDKEPESVHENSWPRRGRKTDRTPGCLTDHHGDIEMILKILADARKVNNNRDIVFPEFNRWPNA